MGAFGRQDTNGRNCSRRETMPILKNQNVALIGICDCLERMSRDLDMLHSKLQPILKSLSDDQEDWQQRVRPGT